MSVKKEDFRAIMSFLLNFIKKERQAEMLVDKLCQRFPKSTSISQKANIAYCLANVKCNEKCIKILNDHFNLYKDALFDEDVLKNFMSIALKSKKFRAFCRQEYFVSAIDRLYFAQNDFIECLYEHGLGKVTRVSRAEWSYVRSILGKPRCVHVYVRVRTYTCKCSNIHQSKPFFFFW